MIATRPRSHDLVEIQSLEPSIQLDVRYARTDNFLGRAVYPEARAFLQRPVADALVRVHRRLGETGHGIVVFDGYRPWSVTQVFWDEVPEDKKRFVANPAKGSVHNRGAAVDLSMFRLFDGGQVTMPSDFDEMNDKAYVDYAEGTPESRELRDLLIRAMATEGFEVYRYEWWHFDHPSGSGYPIMDLSFAEILGV